MGTFISPDSIVANVYDPQSLNPYAYCLNNPLIFIDPSGRWTVSVEGSFGFGAWGGSIGLSVASNGLFGSISLGPGEGAALTATLDPLGEPSEGTTLDASIQGGNAVVGGKGTISVNEDGSVTPSAAIGWGLGFFSRQGALTTTVDLTNSWGAILGFFGFDSESDADNDSSPSPEHESIQGMAPEE